LYPDTTNSSFTIYAPSGSTINFTNSGVAAASNTVAFVLGQYHTVTLMPLQVFGTGTSNTALWLGLAA
jgi:hypothetical protein